MVSAEIAEPLCERGVKQRRLDSLFLLGILFHMPSVEPCKDAVGFDCSAKLNAQSAKIAAAMGFKFAVRYVGLSHPNAGDIDVGELSVILGEIGALWLVQHPRLPGWTPNAHLGQTDAIAAVRNADAVGYLPGSVLWQDLEGVAADSSSTAVIDYCGAYGETLLAGGYLHGLYDGFSSILTPLQLYSALGTVKTYWAASPSYVLPVRGFAVTQVVEDFYVRALGFKIDIDFAGQDVLGDRPMWMAA